MYSDEQIRGNLNSIDRQLLYDMREEMRRSNELLTKLLQGFNREEMKEEIKGVPGGVPCKYCNGTHRNRQAVAACAKKKKKKEVSA
jgi:hypothetical protein